MQKICLTIMLLSILIVPGLTTGQPLPTSVTWEVQEGDTYTWTIDRLKMNDKVKPLPIFGLIKKNPYSTISLVTPIMNATEGDTLQITVLRLGNATALEMDLKLEIEEEEKTILWNSSIEYMGFVGEGGLFFGLLLLLIPAISSVAEKSYYEDLVEYYNQNQTYGTYTLTGNLMIAELGTTSESGNITITQITDITRGLLKKYEYEMQMEVGLFMTKYELELNLVEPINIIPTTGYEYFIGIGVIISLLVITKRKRKAS